MIASSNWFHVLIIKMVIITKVSRGNELENSKDIFKVILNRSTCQNDAMIRINLTDGKMKFGLMITNKMAFIQNATREMDRENRVFSI